MRKLTKLWMLFIISIFLNVGSFSTTPTMANSVNISQTQKEVKGTVVDELGQPMPGVSISIKGTNNGTSTDVDGKFTLKAKKGDVLLISFIGMKEQEIKIEDKASFKIVMKEDRVAVDEVICTGFQTISKERATGSFKTLSISQIEKPTSNIAERIVGVATGVRSTVSENGNVSFEIRGKTSLNSDAQPLIIVDGFPIEGNFNSINPNTVASVTLLKDAAAASIWGARSANGVIVVTTKKGSKGNVKVSISSFYKYRGKMDLGYRLSRSSSKDLIDYEKRGFNSNNFGGPWGTPIWGKSSITKPISQAVEAMNNFKLGKITESQRDAILEKLSNLDNSKQIEDYILNNPVTYQHNVSISGGNSRMQNILSLMYENRTDNGKGNEYEKFQLNLNNSTKITNWLTLNVNSMIQYLNNDYSGINVKDVVGLSSYDMLLDKNGNYTNLRNSKVYPLIFDEFIPDGIFPYSDWSYNPLRDAKGTDRTSKSLNSRIQLSLKLDILEGLKFETQLQYQKFKTENRTMYSEETYYVRNLVNTMSTWDQDPAHKANPNIQKGSILNMDSKENLSYNFRNTISYNTTINDVHAINFIVGSEISENNREGITNPTQYAYNNNNLTVGILPNVIKDFKTWLNETKSIDNYNHSFSSNTERYFSFYSNFSYCYNDKYTFSGSFRTDASNIITDNPRYRYSPFWSTGLGWQVGKEDFLSNIEWLDNLNIRYTFGYNGNVNRSTSFKPLLSITQSAHKYTGGATANIDSYGNPTLRWEKVRTINFAVDFSIFDRKLYGTFEVYDKKSLDLIVDCTLPSVKGTTSQKLNNGEMVNKGIEISLGTSLPINGNDIVFSGNLNFTYNYNEVLSLFKTSYRFNELYGGGSSSYMSGENARTLWSLNYAGLHNQGTAEHPVMRPHIKGVDGAVYPLNGWPPSIDARKYMSKEGVTVAPYLISFTPSFKFYDFDVFMLIDAKFGHVFRRQSFNYPHMSSGNTNTNEKLSEILASDGSDRITIPESEYKYYFWDRFYPYVSYLTENASTIRLKEISISYNIPKTLLNTLKLDKVNVYMQLNNVGTFLFNDYNEDPEYRKGTIKPTTSYTFGLKLTL